MFATKTQKTKKCYTLAKKFSIPHRQDFVTVVIITAVTK